MNALDAGLLLIDKPAGLTSHAVVAFLRRSLKVERVGHLGTLDPFASGVLPILLGGMTRMADSLMSTSKGYRFRIRLGVETDTLDPSGQVIREMAVPADLSAQRVEEVLCLFRGSLTQIPPAYSAIKHKGRPLYEYMRTQGRLDFAIEDRARKIQIHHLQDVSSDNDRHSGTLVLEVHCSKGTYVRSLARDISDGLGTVGHCAELRRIAVGPWSDSDCYALSAETVMNGRSMPSPDPVQIAALAPRVLGLRQVFDRHEPHYSSIRVPEAETELIARLRSGNRVRVPLKLFSNWVSQDIGIHDHPAWEGFIETPDRIFFSSFSMVEPSEGDLNQEPFSLWVQIEPRKQIAAIGP